jgi:hypothetical protein
MNKIIVIIISIILISITYIDQSNSLPLNKLDDNNFLGKNNVEEHLIKGVPIIGQDTRFYCTISSHTMILNYYGYNLSKYEVLYLMGGGFSLYYVTHRYLKPFSSVGCAFRPSNYDYIGNLLNIEFQPFNANLLLPEDKVWPKIWSCIKENVSQNQPVLINLDGSMLIADNIGIKIPSKIWKLIPIHADHAVTVVGYNETNQSICYNDPMYSIFGDEKKGLYRWADTEIFKTAFTKFTMFSPYFPSYYRIKTYQKPENISFNKEEIIEQVYNRNLKRLQGDYRYYLSDIDFPNSYNYSANYTYGINASKEIKRIFGENINTQFFTILQYKIAGKLGIKNTFFTNIENLFIESFNKDISIILDLAVPGYKNVYRTISDEKRIISEVLKDHSSYSKKYELCSDLLKNESEQWSKISEYNRILLNKGFFLTIPKALSLLNQMDQIMDEIIRIEQKILSLEY